MFFGNLKQEKRSGKNKFNAKEKLNASKTKNNITYTKNADTTFDISGTASANTLISVAIVTDIIQRAKSYYLYSSKEYNLTTFNLSVVVKYADGDTQYIGANKSNVTTLIDKEIKSATIDFYAAEGITVNASNIKLMLVESNAVDNEFEEYGAMPNIDYPSMPVVATGVQKITKLGKNQFKLPDESSVNGITYTKNSDGTFNLHGTSSAQTVFSIVVPLKETTFKVGNKYTISTNFIINVTSTPFFQVHSTNSNTWIKTQLAIGNNLSTTTQEWKESTARDVKFNIIVPANITVNLDNIELQIEDGTEKSDFTAYKEEIFELDLGTTELCKIVDENGNVVAQDIAVYREVDGTCKWQWEKKIEKINFNGSEDWTVNTAWNNSYTQVYHAFTKIENWKIGQTNAILDKLKFYGYTSWATYANTEACLCNTTNNSIYLFIKADRLEEFAMEKFKKFLENNNITLFYELAEPEYEDCTAEQSAVLDNLHKLSLEQGTNNIIIESENGVTAEMQLTYMQDNNLIREQEHKKFEDRLTAIENLLSTTTTSAMLLDNLQEDLESEVG